MATVKWTAGAWTAGMGASDLNSLGSNNTAESSLSAPQIDTSTSGEIAVQFEFVGGSISPGSGANITVILRPISSDGTNYVNGAATGIGNDQIPWMNYPHAVIALRLTATSTQLAQSDMVSLPPGKYKIQVLNRAGVSLAASGNQINVRLLTEQIS